MNSRRNLLWLFPLFLFLTFPLWKKPVSSFLAPGADFDSSPPVRQSEGYNFNMQGVTILQSENDRETARIQASTAHSTDKPGIYVLEKVDAELIDDNGGITQVLADIGSYDTDKKLLELSRNVVITNRVENYTMTTELLFYNGKDRAVFSPVKSMLQGNGIAIGGSSFQHDINTGTYTVGGRVSCILQGTDEG